MVYLDCRNATPGTAGAGCQKSCFTLDMDCVSAPTPPGTPYGHLPRALWGWSQGDRSPRVAWARHKPLGVGHLRCQSPAH